MKRPLFITFEGTDGVGKSTQIRLVQTWLKNRGRRVVLTREPGGGPLAEKIRNIILDPRMKMADKTELFLYEAARADHVESVIKPALRSGAVVLCDRFTDATIAYQGFGRKLNLDEIKNLNRIATGRLKPDLTILLDHPPHVALKKAHARGVKDRLEKEGVGFQKKVRHGYLWAAEKEPGRIKKVNVQPTPEKTHLIIRTILERALR